MQIKVCGMRNTENIEELCKLPIDYIGFIFFHKSARFADNVLTQKTANAIPAHIKKTGVFVNAGYKYIAEMAQKYSLDCIQMHGAESPEECKKIKSKLNKPVLKAFGIDENFDFSLLSNYNDACDYFLFDTKSPKHGGTGIKFDWRILDKYTLEKPIFLSGGITADDYNDALTVSKKLPIAALDINSKFEIEPALKDIELIDTFIKKIKA